MQIAVLGSSGRVGCTLIPYLISCGYNVCHNFINPTTNARADLTELKEVTSILDVYNPEIIINLAAFTDVDECEKKPISAYLVNVKIVENIVKWILSKNNKCHLIQLSTDHLYDGNGPHKEEEHILTNYYSYSKYTSELVASKVSSTILRTNFIGRSKCNIRRSLTDWLMDSILSKQPFVVFDDVFFSPLTLNKLAELIEIVVKKRTPGLFNMGSKNGMSKAELAFTFAKILGLSTDFMTRGNSDSANLITYRPKDMRMDSSLFEETFDVELPSLENELLSLKHSYESYSR